MVAGSVHDLGGCAASSCCFATNRHAAPPTHSHMIVKLAMELSVFLWFPDERLEHQCSIFSAAVLLPPPDEPPAPHNVKLHELEDAMASWGWCATLQRNRHRII